MRCLRSVGAPAGDDERAHPRHRARSLVAADEATLLLRDVAAVMCRNSKGKNEVWLCCPKGKLKNGKWVILASCRASVHKRGCV